MENSVASIGEDALVHFSTETIEPKQKRRKVKAKSEMKTEDSEQQHVETEDKSEDEEKSARTVFVGNLPLTYTRAKLLKFFKTCGDIETTRIRSVVPSKSNLPRKAATIKQSFNEKAHCVNGYVTFKDIKSVEKALKKNATDISGHFIRVDTVTEESRLLPPNTTVFVGNIAYDTHEDAIRDFFTQCGVVVAVRVIRERNQPQHKGIAYVSFMDEASVGLALKLHGQKFTNRPLRVTKVLKPTQLERSKQQQRDPKHNASSANNEHAKRLPKKIAKKINSKRAAKNKSIMK